MLGDGSQISLTGLKLSPSRFQAVSNLFLTNLRDVSHLSMYILPFLLSDLYVCVTTAATFSMIADDV